MKITDVKTTLLYSPFKEKINDAARKIAGRDVILIEIQTDEGITGVGFLTGLGVASGSEAVIIKDIIDKSLKPIVLQQDPLRIERLWEKMYKGTTRFGRKGAAIRAISGMDIAMWDLLGKKADIPLYKLLGGYSNKVKVYASGGFYTDDKNDTNRLIDEMMSYVDQGFKVVKMKVGRDVYKDAKRVESVRKAIGNEVCLLVDANEAWDFSSALNFANRVQDYDIYWLEEPVAPDDIDGFIQLTQRSPIPIAAGENEYTKFGFKDLITHKAVHVVQPDVTRVGGISEWMKVASMARAWNMPCVNHAVQEIHVSLIAAVSNAPFMEYFSRDHYLQTFLSELFVGPHCVHQVVDGYVEVPEAPGLGLEIDWDVVKKHTISKNWN
ncbi:arabinonate dehydratase [Aeromicrobium ponti]|uniref:D-arabinonate dehydratase n=1 Tax=Cytobacillus oceanisediminis TaxID=665099 RepID=A0A562JR92_9BACI|nr:mandelate racemase/muconate lactonizing enzyme family protein [Cytobacillus oceanisediminis]TWH85710.1 D-arabinonate dehydratase [Cytobacillus oceanisediminis]